MYLKREVICRDEEFIKFCDSHPDYFNEEGLLDSLEGIHGPETYRIKGLFGLDMIYHYRTKIPANEIIDSNFFKNEVAVDYDEWTEEKTVGKTVYWTPIWDKHYIKLKVNILGNIPKAQLQNEFWNRVEDAREEMGIKAQKENLSDEEIFKVWELNQQGKSKTEIIKRLWPKEYKEATAEQGSAKDKLYEKRIQELLREKGEIPDEENNKIHREIYGENSNGSNEKIKLYQRVNDKLETMEKWFQRVRYD